MIRRERGVIGMILLALLTACSAAPSESKGQGSAMPLPRSPTRIVSMNPCADAILREVAAPGQISAISHYSHDPRATSVSLEWAQRYPAVSDAAEDVIAMRPDLVIASTYVAPQTVFALRKLGIPLLRFDAPGNIAQSKVQIEMIAAHIGRRKQGRALIAQIENAVQRASTPVEQSAPLALVWQENGLVLGSDTLTGDLLAKTGFASAAAAMHIAQWGMVPLEDLLMRPPEIVMTSKETGEGGLGYGRGRVLSHPALREIQQRIMIADLPARLLRCGGPSIIPAAQRLAAIRSDWERAHLR